MIRSFAFLALALTVLGGVVADDLPTHVASIASQLNCTSPSLENSAAVPFGLTIIQFHSVSCADDSNSNSSNSTSISTNTTTEVSKRSLLWPWPLSSFWYISPFCFFCGTCRPKPPSGPPPSSVRSVCGSSCRTSCNADAGILPPISEDCQAIKDAVTVMAGNIASTFTVNPNHLETLTFGTCSYFFSNLGSKKQLEYCWSDLSSTASAAGTACFPPNQFSMSEGLCTASDGSWAVGAAHS